MAKANIAWINGPVLRASTGDRFRINEAVLVGAHQLLVEVIRIDTRELVIQVYEDTTGLRPGDPVLGTGAALSVKLGPGLLGNIFDGLLRPLSGAGQYVAPGARQTRAAHSYAFQPTVQPGDHLTRGAVFGAVQRPDARAQRCLLPPDCAGEVVSVAQPGEYPEDHPLCVLRGPGDAVCEVSMSHRWPVRMPRPVASSPLARARTPSRAEVNWGIMLDASPPCVMMPCTRASSRSCWRSKPMPLNSTIMASSALMPLSGEAPACEGLP